MNAEPRRIAYSQLPETPGGARSGWGLFGDRGSLGLFNELGAEQTLAAAQLVRRGAVFPLDVRSDYITPPIFSRGALRRTTFEVRKDEALDDVFDNFYPQAGSQWDAIGHVAFRPGEFYDGATTDDMLHGRRNTIDFVAQRGIATRGVLVDVGAAIVERGGAGGSVPVTASDIDSALAAAGLTLRRGDVLLLHTGFLHWYGQQDAAERRRMSRRELLTAPGIEHTAEMAEYLWDSQIVAIATDTAGAEVWPPDERAEAWPFGFMHQILLGQFGMGLGELWWLHDLAMDCRDDGVFEVLLTSAPMNVPGAIGSPANALAVK
ncbi:cyclase family protein [Cryobacterium sp. Y62]|uniref:cyclase family protein n=1 Tax=Cryobacterium sp. Y62 TaxID=2048284 RepID=UPI000CE4C057|nr:cyclase family protein [Cryobacterium sp. Y62]